ncbi:MAG: DEAD/DEAH box helicase [Spirochaetales bacterium]
MSELAALLEELKQDSGFTDCVTRWEHIPERAGEYRDFPESLRPDLADALRARGIHALYSHQAEAWDHVISSRHTTIVTPTASGKTLCYNLPILQTILDDPAARALYMFPTKALSQDQQAELNGSVNYGQLPVKIATYDGDTPTSVRAAARTTGQIIISNPDMLHSGVLPNHPKWITFLKNLRFVVIDEVHTYRGVFGSHLTNLIRRLKRICRFYGADPVFVCCSATIGNPRELASKVVEEDMELVDHSGAPRGEKHIILYNPPLVDRVQGIRRGVVLEAQRLALQFLRRRIKTIVFAKSRTRTELIASYINKSLENTYTENSRIRVESYRGGYLPGERRSIEKGLRDGDVHGVVSTNALELGIDIGGLDVAISAGLPGAISSAWQQAGRAGRRNALSVALLIASSHPLDQYMIKNPDYFFGRSPENGFIDPENVYVLTDHLKCATFELPFRQTDPFPGFVGDYLHTLEETGVVRYTNNTFYWSDRSYPAEHVSLRSATNENVVIVDTTGGRHEVIGEIDRPSAKEEVYENAVYIHRGRQYFVTDLDIENRRCYVEETDVNYYTDAIVKRDIKVLYEDDRRERADCVTIIGDILVRTQVAKFKKIRYKTHENIGYGEISLPEEQMHTRCLAVAFPAGTTAGDALAALPAEAQPVVVARLGALLKNIAPVFLLCEPRDIGVAERIRDPHFEAPALYLYDNYPGGIGLSEMLDRRLFRVLEAARALLDECECSEGCPNCIGPRDSRTEIDSNPKRAVGTLLNGWLSSVEARA